MPKAAFYSTRLLIKNTALTHTISVEFVFETCEKPMKIEVFSYLRVSGKGQLDGDGFPRQRDTIFAYAESHEMTISMEFRDEGVSGTKDIFERDGLTNLFLAVKTKTVKTVLVERADRLARDLMIAEILLGEFRKFGVKVIAADSDTDLTVGDGDPTRTLVRQMLGAVAQWEKSIIVQKLRAARTRIRKNEGRCEGRKSYGARAEEQEVIQNLLNLQSKGYSIAEITKQLNVSGVKPRTTKRAGKDTKWHPTMVQRILAQNKTFRRTVIANEGKLVSELPEQTLAQCG